jgi:uncharacterized protein
VRLIKTKALRWLLLLALFPLVAHALIAVPPLQGHLTDLTKTLNAEQAQAIEQSLTAFENRKGTQIAILILPTTGPEPIEPFSIRVAEKWKIGRKRQDDGVILVIAKADRAVRIEVGYGLEGVLTDLHSQRIVSDIILPHFKQNDFYGGITTGIADIIRRIDGEPNLGSASAKSAPSVAPFGTQIGALDGITNLPMILIGALLIGGVLRLIFGRIPGALLTGILVTLIAWFVIGALFFAVVAGTVALGLTLWGGGLLGIAARLLAGGRGGGRGGGGGLGGGGFRGGGGGFGGGGGSGRW